MDIETAKRKFHAFIHARSLAVIATTGPDGKPEAALMNIAVTPELEIIFETTDATRKFANLKTNSRVSFVIGWDGDETLQYDGVTERLEGRALEEARARYVSVFPQKLSHQNWPGNHYFWARPLWIRFSNYQLPRKVEEYRFRPDAAARARTRAPWWRSLLRPAPRQRN
jgi:hypothetical protein